MTRPMSRARPSRATVRCAEAVSIRGATRTANGPACDGPSVGVPPNSTLYVVFAVGVTRNVTDPWPVVDAVATGVEPATSATGPAARVVCWAHSTCAEIVAADPAMIVAVWPVSCTVVADWLASGIACSPPGQDRVRMAVVPTALDDAATVTAQVVAATRLQLAGVTDQPAAGFDSGRGHRQVLARDVEVERGGARAAEGDRSRGDLNRQRRGDRGPARRQRGIGLSRARLGVAPDEELGLGWAKFAGAVGGAHRDRGVKRPQDVVPMTPAALRAGSRAVSSSTGFVVVHPHEVRLERRPIAALPVGRPRIAIERAGFGVPILLAAVAASLSSPADSPPIAASPRSTRSRLERTSSWSGTDSAAKPVGRTIGPTPSDARAALMSASASVTHIGPSGEASQAATVDELSVRFAGGSPVPAAVALAAVARPASRTQSADARRTVRIGGILTAAAQAAQLVRDPDRSRSMARTARRCRASAPGRPGQPEARRRTRSCLATCDWTSRRGPGQERRHVASAPEIWA